MINTLVNPRIEDNSLNLIRDINKTLSNKILKSKLLYTVFLVSQTMQGCSCSPFLFNIVLEV